MRYFLVIPILIAFASTSLFAQNSDNITWSSFQLTKSIDGKNSVAFKPIIRHNQNITKYQNFSLDLAYRRKFGDGWHAQLTTRYWFIPDNTDRYFLWYDLGWGKKIKKSKLSSHVRFHNAIDIKDRIDPDFFRWKTKWTFPPIGKFTFEMSLEPWYRLDTVKQWVRMRYEPGVNYKINDNWIFQAVYRREINKGDAIELNAGVFNLGYKF